MTPNINKILALPAFKGTSHRGANMGRCNWIKGKPERLHLQQVNFFDDGYDSGGAYWGSPANLWCAFSPDSTENEESTMVFVRANSREIAKQKTLAVLPGTGWKFFR